MELVIRRKTHPEESSPEKPTRSLLVLSMIEYSFDRFPQIINGEVLICFGVFLTDWFIVVALRLRCTEFMNPFLSVYSW